MSAQRLANAGRSAAAATMLVILALPAAGAEPRADRPQIGPSGITYQGSTEPDLGMALGGLGTSTFTIGRDGAIKDVRLQNEWSGPVPPASIGTFLAVHARKKTANGAGAGRVLQLDVPAGLEGVQGLSYKGRFPFVEIAYRDEALPCEVTMEAFSPFVPHDAQASSLPVVFFTFRLRNPGPEPVVASAALSWTNDITAETQALGWPASGNQNVLLNQGLPTVLMDTCVKELAGSEYLLACLPADGVRYSAVADWWRAAPVRKRGNHVGTSDDKGVAEWRAFLDCGALPDESRYDDGLGRYSLHTPVGAVAGQVELAPGEEKEIRFALVWYFPYHWDRRATTAKLLLGHQYATRFPGGTRAVADWAFARRGELHRRSLAWRRLVEQSSLPPYCRALMTEVLYLLPRLSWWLADGTFVLHESANCPRIEAILLDVYVAPVLSAMFPELHAAKLRAVAACQLPNGEIPSTLGVTSVHQHEYRVFSPGDASVFPIVTAWEILWGGDPAFAAAMYPAMKKSLQWAARDLDRDRDGVVDVHGIDQGWDTFPMFGAAAYIADQWIAALLAGEKTAQRFGDGPFAQWCREARAKASHTVEKVLWNGDYYDLAHDPVSGSKSAICFADQFTYGTVPAGMLDLGDVHPPERVRRSLETIWRLNVKPCKFVCRMGSNPDGTPADSTIHKKQEGQASQSNAFTPVSTAPLASAAIRHGMIEEGLTLVEQTADVIVNHVKGPWSGQLLFDSRNAKCFYGLHYSDCLILWDVPYALLGARLDMAQRSIELAPPRIPVRMPLFWKLYCGQVEFTAPASGGIELCLSNATDEPSILRTLTIRLPAGVSTQTCSVRQGTARQVRVQGPDTTILSDVVIPPRAEFTLCWK